MGAARLEKDRCSFLSAFGGLPVDFLVLLPVPLSGIPATQYSGMVVPAHS